MMVSPNVNLVVLGWFKNVVVVDDHDQGIFTQYLSQQKTNDDTGEYYYRITINYYFSVEPHA